MSDLLNAFAYQCCAIHDEAYRTGITVFDKFAADASLGLCVARTGHPIWAALMVVAVATFGWFWWNRRPN